MSTITAGESRGPERLRSLAAWLDALSPSAGFLLVTTVLLCLYLSSATYDLRINTDTAMTAMPAWTVAEQGTLDLSSHRDFLAGRDLALHESRMVGDALYSGRNPGAIAWGIPFYVLAQPFTPNEPLPVWPAAVAAAVASALAVALLYLGFRRLVRPVHALGAALVFGTVTTTWAVSADALWTHGPAQLGIAAAILLMARARPASSGLMFGFALLARPYVAFGAAAAGLSLGWAARSTRPVIRLGLASLIGLLTFVLYTRLVFDQWSVLGGYYLYEDAYVGTVLGGGGEATLPSRVWAHASNFLRALGDADQGLVVYTPVLVLLLPGLRRAWRAAEPWVRAAALGAIAEFVAQIMINGWWGGDFFFGYRYSLEAVTLAAPLFVLTWREYVLPDAPRMRLVGILIGVNALWMGYGAVIEPYKG